MLRLGGGSLPTMGDDRSRFECPPQDRVAAYVQGGLGQADTVKFEAHVDTCAPCGRRLAMTRTLGESASGSPPEPATAAPMLTRGTAVDRYLLIEVLGSGGMGVVYLAYDPDLDRKLALKLL